MLCASRSVLAASVRTLLICALPLLSHATFAETARCSDSRSIKVDALGCPIDFKEHSFQEGEAGYCSNINRWIDSNHAGYTGDGFVNTPNSKGQEIVWDVRTALAGPVEIAVRFANGRSARAAIVKVNNQNQGALEFKSTRGWENWATETISVNLQAGLNKLQVVAETSGGLPNVDSLVINGVNLQGGDCDFDALNTDADSDGIVDAWDFCPNTITGGEVDASGCLSKAVIGPFEANYYDEQSGALIATETVDRPSIKYSWANFHDIDSPNFYAVWEGNIELAAGVSELTIGFEVSWSDTSLFVDGVLVSAWSSSNKKIPLDLDAGPHTIRVEYHNNWYTVGFNTSFLSYPELDKNRARELIAPNLLKDTYIAYVGANESKDRYNNVQVSVPETDKPVFLVLSTYDSVNWVIDNPALTDVVGVMFHSHAGSSSVSHTGKSIPLYNVSDISRGYDRFDAIKADILAVTGLRASYLVGEYGITSVSIPYSGQDELDSDGDQVHNGIDQCPDTLASVEVVDQYGCEFVPLVGDDNEIVVGLPPAPGLIIEPVVIESSAVVEPSVVIETIIPGVCINLGNYGNIPMVDSGCQP